MGYRSEVVLVVGKEIMPQFMVTMAKSREARAMEKAPKPWVILLSRTTPVDPRPSKLVNLRNTGHGLSPERLVQL